MFDADYNIPGACSTINLTDIITDHGINRNKNTYNFENLVKKLNNAAYRYRTYSFMFCSCDVNSHSNMIKWLQDCGFKFSRPIHNIKNDTTIKLGIISIPAAIRKTTKLLEEIK